MKALYSTLVALAVFVVFGPLAISGPFPTWDKQFNSPSRFKVLKEFNNEAVFDKETGLVWEQSPDTGSSNWFGAQERCNRLAVGNRKGWRLPTIQELASLVDPSAPPFTGLPAPLPGPTLPSGHPFENVQSSLYWSATINAFDTSLARTVNFLDGDVSSDTKVSRHFIWCVRGGQGPDTQ